MRLTQLDGLRGIAALAVLLYHYLLRFGQLGYDGPQIHVANLGQYGVQLFFVVSGFVIYWSIQRASAWQFAWSRFSRLYPVFWACVTLTFLVVTFFGLPGREREGWEYLVNLTMLQGFVGVDPVDSVYWTLTMELVWYFWMFVALATGQLRNIERWLLGWVALSAAYFAAGLDYEALAQATLLRWVPLFGAGVCFYRIWSGQETRWTWAVLLVGGASLVIQSNLKTIIALAIIYAVFAVVVTGRLRWLGSRPLVYLGTISYALYLTHANIGYVILRELGFALGLPVAIAFSLLAASALTYGVERPAQRFLRSRRPTLITRISTAA